MNTNIFKIISLWFLAHAIIWIVFFKIITHTSFLLALGYFSFWNIVLLYLYKDLYSQLFAQSKKRDAMLIVLSYGSHLLTYWVCHQYLTPPLEMMKSSTASFIQVDAYFIWIKPLDALLQQLMIIILITKLHQNKIPIKTIALLLGVLFGVVHIVSVERLDINIAITLTITTTLFACIMPYLLMNQPTSLRSGFRINQTA